MDQAAISNRFFEVELTEENQGFLGHVVLVETAWVLQRAYGVSSVEIRQTIRDLLATRKLVIERREIVAAALALAETKWMRFRGCDDRRGGAKCRLQSCGELRSWRGEGGHGAAVSALTLAAVSGDRLIVG